MHRDSDLKHLLNEILFDDIYYYYHSPIRAEETGALFSISSHTYKSICLRSWMAWHDVCVDFLPLTTISSSAVIENSTFSVHGRIYTNPLIPFRLITSSACCFRCDIWHRAHIMYIALGYKSFNDTCEHQMQHRITRNFPDHSPLY